MCLLYKDTYKYADNSNNHKTVTPIWLVTGYEALACRLTQSETLNLI